MGQRHFSDYDESPVGRKTQDYDLLRGGWRPLPRQVDMVFLGQLVLKDPWELLQRSLDVASDVANALGRREFDWWANLLNVFSENTRYDIQEFLDYVTPEPPGPDYQYKDVLNTDSPITILPSRHSIPIEDVLRRLQELTVLKVLKLLGHPDQILQRYQERHFFLPTDRFMDWERLQVLGSVSAHWIQSEVWLLVCQSDWGRRHYSLVGKNLAPLVSKATAGLAVMLSGYQSRVGQVQSRFDLNTFPATVQRFTDQVQQAVLSQPQLAVIVQGAPGTGKTAWTQAVAKEILVPLGFVVFILDHDAVEHFSPPSYLERICLIINEADNLAQDRSSEVAQRSMRTEHILSLLDGTLYQSVMDEQGIQDQQRLVVLMTCNTTERFDPAVLRKGRVDLTCEFTHLFV